MATKPLFGDPTNAPVWSKAAVLLGSLTATTPTAGAAFTLNNTTRTESVTTTNASAAITGTTFSAADVGLAITGTGIPAATTVLSVASATNATLSANATASGTITATIGTAVTVQWDPIGLLSDDSPFDDGEESINISTHSAFGFGVYAKTYKDQEEKITFTALETTLVSLGILYDASGVVETATTKTGKLKQRNPAETFKIALHRENGTQMERKISASHAYIDSISRAVSDGASAFTVTAFIVPSAAKELYDYYFGPLV